MKRLLTFLLLLWLVIPARAQMGSQTGAYGSVGVTAAQIAANLPGIVVTNYNVAAVTLTNPASIVIGAVQMNPAPVNYFLDMFNATSSFTGQLGVTETGHGGSALWVSSNPGIGTNAWDGPISLFSGLIDVGCPYWYDLPGGPGSAGFQYENLIFSMGMGPSNATFEKVWGTNYAGLNTNSTANQPGWVFQNGNPFSGGAYLNLLTAYTNPASGALVGQDAHGNNIYIPQFGMQIFSLSDAYGIPTNGGISSLGREAQDANSYCFLLNSWSHPFYISYNDIQRAGDTYAGQVPAFTIDPTAGNANNPNIVAGFPAQIGNAYMSSNPNWAWALRVDEYSNVVSCYTLNVRSNETVAQNLNVTHNLNAQNLGTLQAIVSTNGGIFSYGSSAGYQFEDRNSAGTEFTLYAHSGTVAFFNASLGDLFTIAQTSGNAASIGSFSAKGISSSAGFTTTAQPTAANFNWGLIPNFSSTTTNYYFGNWTNGTFVCIWSNTSTTYAIKQIAP